MCHIKPSLTEGFQVFWGVFLKPGSRQAGGRAGRVIKFITQSVKQWGDKHLPQKKALMMWRLLPSSNEDYLTEIITQLLKLICCPRSEPFGGGVCRSKFSFFYLLKEKKKKIDEIVREKVCIVKLLAMKQELRVLTGQFNQNPISTIFTQN